MAIKPRRCLLLTFDAFSTLFHPRRPIPELYSSIAASFGLPTTAITPTRIQTAFKNAYKAQSKSYPNYGRDKVLRGEYGGPRQWWADVIRATFTEVLDKKETRTTDLLPDGMIDTLLDTFASRAGYSLYDDAKPCFDRLRSYKRRQREKQQNPYFDYVVTGIISNSDDRVPAVLKSLGLAVGGTRADADRSSTQLPGFETSLDLENIENKKNLGNSGHIPYFEFDLNMIITSYEAGEEKPNRLIFDVAARQAERLLKLDVSETENVEWTRVHVGDDLAKDCQGATSAGWRGILLDRDTAYSEIDKGVTVIQSLEGLLSDIERYK